ncbi:peroxiredoxin [Methanospirillum lacunae]|uniref:Peroxiredoxin n=1 Tax=Methanospirillum lacunae TaxID=668570 RepID=A0A2V2N1W4_9EURY|nr:peroxiredoxin [Methanospirillum lacunae]PWR70127.1 peroxiredoxin [Methanospirillum lacunae]
MNCDEEYECDCISLPILGAPAPDFEAVTTQGTITLSELQGKWVVLFSHPADFTPVCTTEFIAFAQVYDELKAMNTQLIGLSIDSVHSHIAWIRNIKEKMGIEIPFPVIADLDMKVATLYGMVHPGQSSTATVRTVFFIDDKGILRAMIYYPLSNGRSIPEIVRLVKALQTSDKEGVATPANWQPGDKVIVPPPKTVEEAEKRITEGYDYKDFYLCFKDS